MREIVLDTETTGLDPKSGHRIIEIGCVEIINKIRTGKFFHTYLNPERDVPMEAFKVHGISTEFLRDKRKFVDIAQEFIDFIQDSVLVIHNARFDMKFINHELSMVNLPEVGYSSVIDTLDMARRKFPGSPASLDALCKRFNVDLSSREKHGALLDSELLVEVYIWLCGGKQPEMDYGAGSKEENLLSSSLYDVKREYRAKRAGEISLSEKAAHEEFLKKIKKPLWDSCS